MTHDAVGHLHGFVLVVRHHDGGHAQRCLQVLDFGAQLFAHLRVERRQWLVEQQDRRFGASARASATRCC
jgi:hypothetical protein